MFQMLTHVLILFVSFIYLLTYLQAYAAARMAESTLMGLNGEPNIYECTYVQSDVSEWDLIT